MVIHTTAPDRKTLVKAISEHLGQEANYNGPPSFSYSIGLLTIDREGGLILPEEMNKASIQAFLISKGWLEPELERLNISLPTDGLSSKALLNLISMLYSKQYLLAKALKEDTIQIADRVIERLNESPPESPEDFKAFMDEFKAQGQVTGVDFSDDCLSLSFPLSDFPDVNAAYTHLAVSIIAAAKTATRVKAERLEPENEKYHLRNWLIRLGFGGEDAKGMREVLLRHLKGHSAFRSNVEAQKHRDKYAEIRRIKREVNSGEVQHDET